MNAVIMIMVNAASRIYKDIFCVSFMLYPFRLTGPFGPVLV